MNYYYIKKSEGGCLKFRLSVTIETAIFTGESYHQVVAYVADCYKQAITGKWITTGRYDYYETKNIHCCYNGREAADYVADELGLTRI